MQRQARRGDLPWINGRANREPTPSCPLLWPRELSMRASIAVLLLATQAFAQPPAPLFNDVHLHLTNYIQKGPTVQELLSTLGTRVGRAALFGIPLQQQWSHRISGDDAPKYYLETDAHLYYYSFTDAF